MKIQEAIIKLLLRQPFYGYLASSIGVMESSGVDKIRSVFYPSPVLEYNKTWYEDLSDNLAVGALMHELLHLVLLHPLRRQGRDVLLWNTACDMAVNEYILSDMTAEDAITVERVSKEFRLEIEHFKSAEFYYDALNKLDDGASIFLTDKQIKIRVSGGMELTADIHDELDYDANEAAKRALESVMYQRISEALEEGEAPAMLTSQAEEVYRDNAVDWRNIFKRFLIGRGRMESRRSYKKESRRYEGFPGNKKSVGLRCLLAIDESGSIPDSQVEGFYRELLEINQITSAEIFVTDFDIVCSKPILIQNYVMDQRRVKNGGTDFRPVFNLADEMRIELLIIFTDGDGIAPEFVNQRVLWILTKGGKKPSGYGFEVMLQG